MQQRVFLSNKDNIKRATVGMHVVTNHDNTSGKKPCEDYVLECKREKSYNKLNMLFEKKFNNELTEEFYNKFRRKLLLCDRKEEFINFLNKDFKILNDLKLFFKSFNK